MIASLCLVSRKMWVNAIIWLFVRQIWKSGMGHAYKEVLLSSMWKSLHTSFAAITAQCNLSMHDLTGTSAPATCATDAATSQTQSSFSFHPSTSAGSSDSSKCDFILLPSIHSDVSNASCIFTLSFFTFIFLNAGCWFSVKMPWLILNGLMFLTAPPGFLGSCMKWCDINTRLGDGAGSVSILNHCFGPVISHPCTWAAE